jgi:hypothetical protein
MSQGGEMNKRTVTGWAVGTTAIFCTFFVFFAVWPAMLSNIDRIADLEVQAETLWSAVSVSEKQAAATRIVVDVSPPEFECDGLVIYRGPGPGSWQPGDRVERSCVDYGVAIHTILDHIGYEFKYIENEPAHHVFVPKEGK